MKIVKGMSNARALTTILTIVFTVVFMIIMFTKTIIDRNKLKNNPEYTYGIIVKKYPKGYKTRPSLKCQFIVNGELCYGRMDYMPHREHINIGDTCVVMYEKGHPDNYRILVDENKHLIINSRYIENLK